MDVLDTTYEFLKNNYQWLFSGLGIAIIGIFLKQKYSSINKVKQEKIKAGGMLSGEIKGVKFCQILIQTK